MLLHLFYHPLCPPSSPPCSSLLLLYTLFLPLILLFLPSSHFLLLPGVAAAAVPPEPPQEVGPEAAEGAGVASGAVSRSDVLLQVAEQEEGAFALLTAVRTLHVVVAHHVADGKTCRHTGRDSIHS